MRKSWFGFVVAVLAGAFSAWAYPRLPPEVATHWNVRGAPDDYSTRLFAAAFMPLLIAGVTGLMHVLPKIDPRRANYAKFLDTYWLLINGVLLFLGAVHVFVILISLGVAVPLDRVVIIGLGLVFMLIGNHLGRIQPNWFAGIRTPWTLSSETVWRKTHSTGRWFFVFGGLAMVAMAFVPGTAKFVLIVTTVVVITLAPVLQSYLLWRAEQREVGD
ncbi:MAG: SdpI family protein [Gemmatimonadota bacterium]